MNVALGALYFVSSWVASPATPGQRLFGLRVARVDDHGRLSPAQAIVRWLMLIGPLSLGTLAIALFPGLLVFLLPATLAWYLLLFVTAVISPKKQGLHDRLSGTVVRAGGRQARPAPAVMP